MTDDYDSRLTIRSVKRAVVPVTANIVTAVTGCAIRSLNSRTSKPSNAGDPPQHHLAPAPPFDGYFFRALGGGGIGFRELARLSELKREI